MTLYNKQVQMNNTVYKINHIPSGRYYIGIHLEKLNENLYSYMGSGTVIKNYVNKYPIDEFHKEILFRYETLNESLIKESELVPKELLQDPLVMNLVEGGGKPPRPSKEICLLRNRKIAKIRTSNGTYSDLSHWRTPEIIAKKVETRRLNNNYFSPIHLHNLELQNKARATRKINGNYNTFQLLTPESIEKSADKLRTYVYMYDLGGKFISEHKGLYKIARELNIIPGKIQRNNDPLRIWLRERNDIEAKKIALNRTSND